jgi:hypothetical protein
MVQVKLRMPEPVRAAIESAATRHGVSMNTEAVTRLEASFAADTDVAQLGRALALVMDTAGRAAARMKGDDSWMTDRWCFAQACSAAHTLLGGLLPPDGSEAPEITIDPALLAFYGGDEERARQLLEARRDHAGANIAAYFLTLAPEALPDALGPLVARLIEESRK